MEVRVLSTAPDFKIPRTSSAPENLSGDFVFQALTSAIRIFRFGCTKFQARPAFGRLNQTPSIDTAPARNFQRFFFWFYFSGIGSMIAPARSRRVGSSRVNVNFELSASVNVHALFSQIEILYSMNSNRPFRTIASALSRD